MQQTQDQFDEAVTKASRDAAETQRILSLPYITATEAAKVYPIGKSTLDKMRAKRTGPVYFHVSGKANAFYTHEDIRTWLNKHRQRVM